MASAGGSGSDSPGMRQSTRTGWPVSSASASASTNRAPVGVAITHTSHPCGRAALTKPAASVAGGAPHTIRYTTPLDVVPAGSLIEYLSHVVGGGAVGLGGGVDVDAGHS